MADGDEQLPLTAPDQEAASAEDAHPRNFERAAQQEHRNEAAALRQIISQEVRGMPELSNMCIMVWQRQLLVTSQSFFSLFGAWSSQPDRQDRAGWICTQPARGWGIVACCRCMQAGTGRPACCRP